MTLVEEVFNSFLNKQSIFENKEALTISYTPENIPHREEQIKNVAKILAPILRGEKASNLFIFGKTGTGKTLVITHVCKKLEEIAKRRGLKVKVIYINCKMRKVADTEYRLIAQILKEFGVDVPPTGLPTDEVYRIFFEVVKEFEGQIVLVLDEIDFLVKKSGDEVLYNLTRMNQNLKTKINIVGISNDVKFMEGLDPRVRSSLSEEEIVFPPYDAMQLMDILAERAKVAFREGVVGNEVIAKCAAYAAREHGDARRALDLLRVAGEIAEREGRDKILEEDVDKAQEKIERESIEEVVRTLPQQSKAVLLSALLLLQTREQPVYTGEVYDVYKGIAVQLGVKPLTQRRVSDLIAELDMLGLINAKVISKGRYGRTREIYLSLSPDHTMKIESMLKSELGV